MTETISTECFLKTFTSLALVLYGCVFICQSVLLKRDDDDDDDGKVKLEFTRFMR